VWLCRCSEPLVRLTLLYHSDATEYLCPFTSSPFRRSKGLYVGAKRPSRGLIGDAPLLHGATRNTSLHIMVQ
jgi:hypothetical protein